MSGVLRFAKIEKSAILRRCVFYLLIYSLK